MWLHAACHPQEEGRQAGLAHTGRGPFSWRVFLVTHRQWPFVQGFCCDCSGGQVWQETVGNAQERTRAGLNCDFFENPFVPIFGSPPGSAHCLVYQTDWCAPLPQLPCSLLSKGKDTVCGPLQSGCSQFLRPSRAVRLSLTTKGVDQKHATVGPRQSHNTRSLAALTARPAAYRWDVFTVHESTMDFAITIAINATAPPAANATAPEFAATEVTLTPTYPKRRSDDGRVAGKLLGDLLPFNAFPVLTSQKLLMPQVADLNSLQPEAWMLLDPTLISLDGSECNKIGVGFSAFACAPERKGHEQVARYQTEQAARYQTDVARIGPRLP